MRKPTAETGRTSVTMVTYRKSAATGQESRVSMMKR